MTVWLDLGFILGTFGSVRTFGFTAPFSCQNDFPLSKSQDSWTWGIATQASHTLRFSNAMHKIHRGTTVFGSGFFDKPPF